MPKVKMLKTMRGSEDGIRLDTHAEGETYDLTVKLAGIYVREGWAEPADAPPRAPERPRATPPSVQLADAADRLDKPQKAVALKGPARTKKPAAKKTAKGKAK